MSPPLEIHQKTGSIGVDNEISLLSSPKPHEDQAMDLFLNQVAEYNVQSLSFEQEQQQQQQQQNQPSSSTDIGIDPAQVLALQKVKQEPTTLQVPKEEQQKKGKQKSKDTSHSLLHVFTNPLLHAIPILARNFSNFEDFLAQTSLPGQSLLGPGEVEFEQESDFMSPPTTKSDSPWHIRVLGLPHTGAKSRVETQIKICLQLVDTSGELVTNWSHLKLPEHLVAKDKLKRKNQKYGADEKASLTDAQVLILEAAVVCDGQPDNEIIMCTSCVHRERKRLKRKRDNKVARAANKEGGAAKLAALFANDLPDLSDENIMSEERRRILLFNCNEYVEFNNGEATLPTRVTCYCRHHSEKTGFRVVFTVKDNLNHVIATGRSPPIMITDDHKSSKMQQAAARKRSRAEFDMSATESDVPTTSRKKGINSIELETDSGVSSPIASTPATPSSQIDDIPDNPANNNNTNNNNTTTINNNNNNNNNNNDHQQHHTIEKQHPLASDNNDHFISQVQHQNSYVSQGELYDFLTSADLNMLPPQPLLMLPPPPPQQHQQQPQLHQQQQQQQQHHQHHHHQQQSHQQQQQHHHQQQQALSLVHPDQQQQSQALSLVRPDQQQQQQQQPQALSLVHPDQQQLQIISQFTQNPMRRNVQSQTQSNNVYTKLQERNALDKTPNLPRLHRLIPSEGPIYGGSEVTVLGSNFYEGLTCLFGENPATPTHCWSTNTLLCILPPAITAGPVVVSFKEHPLMLEGQDVVLFTYFDESDRALMELALQVVGLKTMGKVEDARQIAMRIVQGDNSDRKDSNNHNTCNNNNNNNNINGFRYKLTPLAATAVYENARKLFLSNLEKHVIASMLAIKDMNREYDYLSIHNQNGHNLLHLATICGYSKLVETLVKLNCNLDGVDKNGFTALHFASWTGKYEIVKLLITCSNLKITNRVGKTAERLAIEAGHKNVVQLFKKLHQPIIAKNVRIPLTDFIPTDIVSLATSILPSTVSNLLSNLYTFTSTTKSAQRVAHSAGQVYNFMLDPF